MAVTLCLSCSLMPNRRSRGHSAGWWLSLRHLISIFSWPQLIKAQRPLRPDVAFPTTSRLQWNSNLVRSSTQLARRTQLSYIIVRRPLDLWNRMFNRHEAEITVMQFRGHSLPVHQSMSVPWEFFSSSHFISQFPPMRFPLITAIRMCHLLPVHHLGMVFLAGSKGQNITQALFVFKTKYACYPNERLYIYIYIYMIFSRIKWDNDKTHRIFNPKQYRFSIRNSIIPTKHETNMKIM